MFRDLLADYALKTNLQILSGTGASGQVLGLGAQTGVTAVTVTATTVAGFYSAIANAIQQIYATRFAAPNVIVMHPRRWAWLISQLDSNSRPLVVPSAQGPTNAVGTFGGLGLQQVVGTIQGLSVVTDPSIPTNGGTGTNEDRVFVLKTDDVVLYESGIKHPRAAGDPVRYADRASAGLRLPGLLGRSLRRPRTARIGASASSPRPSRRTDT